jgi:hypothetical protein
MIERGRTTTPYAFVIPKGQRHSAEAADLVNLFRAHGSEVQVASSDFRLKSGGKDTTTVPVRSGDWIVRLDQPYSATVRTLLAIQKYKADDPPPYDDTGWTLDLLRHVETIKVQDSAIFSKPMQLLNGAASVRGSVADGSTILVKHLGDWRSAALPWKVAGAKVSVADTAFRIGTAEYPAGTYIVENASANVRDAIAALGLNGVAATAQITVKRHAISTPRIALMHSWIETQNEGWIRFAFDQMGIPYTYISDQQISKPGFLDKFDAVFYEHVSGPVTALVNGRSMIGPAIPWKKTAAYPNLGKWDETDDIRPGMGFTGVDNLKRFLERGGLLITTGNSSNLPVSMGFTTAVTVNTTTQLNARGGIYRAQPVSTSSPILYGYDQKSFPIYFNQSPVMSVTPRDTTAELSGIDPALVAAREAQRAKVILRYHSNADSLLVSGLLAGGSELAGKAAVVDAPVGKGHVILFGIRPMWRWESQGSFALALNAIANWNHLEF